MRYIFVTLFIFLIMSCHSDIIKDITVNPDDEIMLVNIELTKKIPVKNVLITDEEDNLYYTGIFFSGDSNILDRLEVRLEENRLEIDKAYILTIRQFNQVYYEWELILEYDSKLNKYVIRAKFLK